ncbi:MAG: hypothetical protein AB7S65_07830 [Sulfuricurvum sp.]
MKQLLSMFSAILIFGGCAEKSAFDLFKMDANQEKSVEQLRTGTILESMETKAILSAVYLNPVYPNEYKDGEYFIGAFYFQKQYVDAKKWSLEDFGYRLTLNSSLPISMEELKETDSRRLLIPIRNKWNRFYLIRFAPTAETALTLKLEKDPTGSVELNYQK